jgi:Tfp pilus assembly protein FimT
MIELIVIFAIIGILAAIAIPAISVWMPNYSLRSAARDIYSNLQLAKLGAIKQNKTWGVVFDPDNGSYFICSDDGDGDYGTLGDNTCEKEVNFTDYGGGIDFGGGNATQAVPGGAIPGDNVSYSSPANATTFNSRGIGTAGYVYIANNSGRVWAIGTQTSGVVLLRRWNGSDWD